MNPEILNILQKATKKIGTLLVDRRLIFYAASVILVLLGVPNAAEQATELDAQVNDAIVLIGQLVTIFLGMIALVTSWTKRPPSGLEYDKIVSDQPQLRQIKELLEDLGVRLE